MRRNLFDKEQNLIFGSDLKYMLLFQVDLSKGNMGKPCLAKYKIAKFESLMIL